LSEAFLISFIRKKSSSISLLPFYGRKMIQRDAAGTKTDPFDFGFGFLSDEFFRANRRFYEGNIRCKREF
jgi:hypothetical protein